MSALIASVVPDVSGIDKVFDYIVPEGMVRSVSIGCKVRITLNGRRVPGWVVRLGDRPADSVDPDSLLPIVSVSGSGVDPDVVDLTSDVARRFMGPRRQVLAQASAPRVRPRPVHRRRTSPNARSSDPVSSAASTAFESGGGLVVVPPLASALTVVAEAATRGPVLVVCPTQKMAHLGAASLRRRGLSTAVVPDEWDDAREGVDVVIGARSAVFAPCAGMSSIVVIDEHDELLHEERSPTWHAREVATMRASSAQVPCILTSPVPSAEAMASRAGRIVPVDVPRAWPRIVVVDLDEVPVAGSLLSSAMLDALSDRTRTCACVLNTKGVGRTVVCRACRCVQACNDCGVLLALDEESRLQCPRCREERGSVCVGCGRTSFMVPRGGISQLARQLRASLGIEPVEVSADTSEAVEAGSVYVGTEAVLHRMTRLDVVVFADIDRDLGAPRMTAAREVLSLLVRAARVVGDDGTLIVQTRRPDHPVLAAMAAGDVPAALMEWQRDDLARRESFALPPFTRLVHVGVTAPASVAGLGDVDGVETARFDDHIVLKSADENALDEAVASVRRAIGTSARVHADPQRY